MATVKCESRIVKSYKRARADCIWPVLFGSEMPPLDRKVIPNPDLDKYPEVCGGDIKIEVKAVDEPDYYSGHYAVIRIEATCNRCKHGYFPGMLETMIREEEEILAEALVLWIEKQRSNMQLKEKKE